MSTRKNVLKQRCEKFAALVSGLEHAALTPRQRQVVQLRTAGLTLVAIGKRLGVSAERVRQIEARLRSRALLKRAVSRAGSAGSHTALKFSRSP